jgi:acetoin utilization deacetylase AcuC-like enzyme
MKLAVVYHEDFGKDGYPVLKERIRPSFEALMESGIVDGEDVRIFRPKPAALDIVSRAHTEGHMMNMLHDPYRDVALLSVGSVLLASELVASGNANYAFAYTGTAGHHASKGGCWGFCYFNDIAISILHLRDMGMKRFLIIDVDPHFGDGTRNFFGEDVDVFHINFHSGSGHEFDHEMNNYDIGLGWGSTDAEFLKELELAVDLSKGFDYDMAFLIFGHDSHQDDYGGFDFTCSVYPKMTRMIKDAADERGLGLVFVLSGGSNVLVAKESIPSVIAVLAGV